MEERLLLWLYAVSAGYGAVLFFRRRGTVGLRYVITLATLAAACAAGLLFRDLGTVAAIAGTAGFAVFLLLPGVLVRRARRAAGRGRFRAAWRLTRAAAVLLPAPALSAEARLYREVAAAGPDHPAAGEIRRRFAPPPGRPAFLRHPAGPLLALAMLAAFAATALAGGSRSTLTLLTCGANYGPLTLSTEPWRLLTATFLHAGLLHLGLNLAGVLMLAAWLSPLVGGALATTLFLLTGAAGNLASALLYGDAGVISVGASGGAMGLVGAGLAIFFRWRAEPHSRQRLSGLVFVALATIGLGFVEPQIDNGAHLVGLAAGLVAGAAVTRGPRLPRSAPRLACAALVLLAAGSFVLAAVSRERRLAPEPFTTPDFEFPRPGFLAPRAVSSEWVFAGPPVGNLVVETLPDGGAARLAERLLDLARAAGAPAAGVAVDGPEAWPGRPGVQCGAVESASPEGRRRQEVFLVPAAGGDRAALLTFEYSPPDDEFVSRVIRPVVFGFRRN